MSDKHTLKTTIAASLLAGQTRSKKGHIPIFIVLVQFGDTLQIYGCSQSCNHRKGAWNLHFSSVSDVGRSASYAGNHCKAVRKHSLPSLCRELRAPITPSGGDQTCLCILPRVQLEHSNKLIEQSDFWSYLGIGRKKYVAFLFSLSFLHLNFT